MTKKNYLVLFCTFLICCMAFGPLAGAQEEATKKPVPPAKCLFSITLDYTMVSDYVWRGANLSEPANGEGGEKLNHQVNFGLSADLKDLIGCDAGNISGFVWGEWYGGQKALNDEAGRGNGSDAHLQEVDYGLGWEIELAKICPCAQPLQATFSVQLLSYTLPNVRGDSHDTYEYALGMSFDDAGWFGDNKTLLSPSITYYYDFDNVDGGWLDLGFSHEIALGDYLGDLPVIKDMTMSASFTAGWDLHYNDTDSSTLGTLLYGLDFSLPLNDLLTIPEGFGEFSCSAFVAFCDARNESLQDDVFYGGLTLGVAW